jgi:hypothetical protein
MEMSEDEARRSANHEEETDEVEAHRKGNAASEEAPAEGEKDDDFEAHVKRTSHSKKV